MSISLHMVVKDGHLVPSLLCYVTPHIAMKKMCMNSGNMYIFPIWRNTWYTGKWWHAQTNLFCSNKCKPDQCPINRGNLFLNRFAYPSCCIREIDQQTMKSNVIYHNIRKSQATQGSIQAAFLLLRTSNCMQKNILQTIFY